MASTQHKEQQTTAGHSRRGLRLIAVFKFAKAAVLFAVALGSLGLLKPGSAEYAHDWAASLATSYRGALVQHALVWFSGLPPRRLEVLGLAAFLFACLFLAEGVGLWLGKRWAEYFTVIATISLIPLELYEVLQRPSAAHFAALGVNIAVVAYLIHFLRLRPAGGPTSPR